MIHEKMHTVLDRVRILALAILLTRSELIDWYTSWFYEIKLFIRLLVILDT